MCKEQNGSSYGIQNVYEDEGSRNSGYGATQQSNQASGVLSPLATINNGIPSGVKFSPVPQMQGTYDFTNALNQFAPKVSDTPYKAMSDLDITPKKDENFVTQKQEGYKFPDFGNFFGDIEEAVIQKKRDFFKTATSSDSTNAVALNLRPSPPPPMALYKPGQSVLLDTIIRPQLVFKNFDTNLPGSPVVAKPMVSAQPTVKSKTPTITAEVPKFSPASFAGDTFPQIVLPGSPMGATKEKWSMVPGQILAQTPAPVFDKVTTPVPTQVLAQTPTPVSDKKKESVPSDQNDGYFELRGIPTNREIVRLADMNKVSLSAKTEYKVPKFDSFDHDYFSSPPAGPHYSVIDKSGRFMFALGDKSNPKTLVVPLSYINKKGLQWTFPKADNYIDLDSVDPDILTNYRVTHFDTQNILDFAEEKVGEEKKRGYWSYSAGEEGDWKRSEKGASGASLVTVDGVPHRPDEIGNAVYAAGMYRQLLEDGVSPEIAAKAKSYAAGMYRQLLEDGWLSEIAAKVTDLGGHVAGADLGPAKKVAYEYLNDHGIDKDKYIDVYNQLSNKMNEIYNTRKIGDVNELIDVLKYTNNNVSLKDIMSLLSMKDFLPFLSKVYPLVKPDFDNNYDNARIERTIDWAKNEYIINDDGTKKYIGKNENNPDSTFINYK